MNAASPDGFGDLFSQATGGRTAFPYQVAFAESPIVPEVVRVPTGAGKTATAVLGWLYRRRYHPVERYADRQRREEGTMPSLLDVD
ncbi:MAG: hypothetical protein ACT4PO_14770, partial [Actinomycetota bacterium]